MTKATRTKKETAAAKETKVVLLKDLAEEFGVEGRVLRGFIRGLGFSAPKTEQEGFGPRSKYQWEEDSEELATIRKAWEEHLESKASGDDA